MIELRLPGDKSLAHRALIFAALARGPSRIGNVPDGDDVEHTIACLRALGTHIDVDVDGASRSVRITPQPWRSLPSTTPLDCGNSGTLARLLMGALVGEGVSATLVGDASLSSRPMKRVADPLRAMFGVDELVTLTGAGTLPATIFAPARADMNTSGVSRVVPTGVASAQVKSALVLACRAFREGTVEIAEPAQSRDHTERMLSSFGASLSAAHPLAPLARGPSSVYVTAPLAWDGFDVDLPGDISSAALLAAYAIAANKSVCFTDVLANPMRTAFVDVLASSGALIELNAERRASSVDLRSGEPTASLTVAAAAPQKSAKLAGLDVAASRVPSLVDEIPALVAVAATIDDVSVFRGLGELRVKESDRVARLVELARSFGARANVDGDDLEVRGPHHAAGAVAVRTDGDHRIAMAALALGRALGVDVSLDVPGCERTSFPGFAAALDDIARTD